MSLEFIFNEAAKTFIQAVKIVMMLFWWIGIGLVRLFQTVRERIEENELKGKAFTPSGYHSNGSMCPACHTMNEAGASTCFACGAQL